MDNRESDVALTLAEFVLNPSRPPTPPSYLLCEAPSDCLALPTCGGFLTPFAVVQAWCSGGTLWKCYRSIKSACPSPSWARNHVRYRGGVICKSQFLTIVLRRH